MAITGINGVNSTPQYSYGVSPTSERPAKVSMDSVEEAQVRGYQQGVENAQAGNDMLNVADGALDSITDSLQRIRELSVKAGNDTLANSDKVAIQDEIKQQLASIDDIAKGTEFNTKKLLDGSMADANLATSPSGKGMEIQLESSTLDTLGIRDYDVTGEFDITKIDDAIAKVNNSRSNIGASQSAMQSQINIGNTSVVNLNDDADEQLQSMIDKVSEEKKNKVMQEYQNFAMMSKMKQQSSDVEKLLNIK